MHCEEIWKKDLVWNNRTKLTKVDQEFLVEKGVLAILWLQIVKQI